MTPFVRIKHKTDTHIGRDYSIRLGPLRTGLNIFDAISGDTPVLFIELYIRLFTNELSIGVRKWYPPVENL